MQSIYALCRAVSEKILKVFLSVAFATRVMHGMQFFELELHAS
jgi:hypothetical protein